MTPPAQIFTVSENVRRWFQRIFWLVIVPGVIAGIVLAVFGDQMAGALTRRIVARATQLAAARGIEVTDVSFARASLAGFGAIRCRELTGRVRSAREVAPLGRALAVDFHVAELVVDAGWPWSSEAEIAAVGGQVDMLDRDGNFTGDQLAKVRVRTTFACSWWKPTEAAALLEAEARQIMQEGWTHLPLEISAVARFTVARRLQTLTVQSKLTREGGARIVLDRAEIEQLSREYVNPLTTTEIDLVAKYPHRAPALLRLCEQASRAARAQRQRDRSFPFDAYRHIYWSWLLTREFGPEFSEEVTEAHEIGATYEVGPAARRMDSHNNAIGRAYALAGVKEDELVDRVLNDPHVMRRPTSTASPRAR